MPESISGDSTGQLPVKVETIQVETTAIPSWTYARITRRQWTLIAITGLLNLLLVCSILCIIVQTYQLAADPNDSTNYASEILTFASAFATLGYITLHSIFSLKQRIWRHQGRLLTKDKKTSYIAVRFGGITCIMWLFTCGWNMIIVARRPVCLPGAPGISNWETGQACQVGRVGIAFAMIAFVASCALFGMLATMSRPFEAHLLNYKHAPPTSTPTITSVITPRQSHSRSTSFASNRYSSRRVSFSTHRSTHSITSNADVDTIDLNSTAALEGISIPAPIRSLGTGIFTSPAQPPPVPAVYATPSPNPYFGVPPSYQPSLSTPQLPLPPRMSTLVSSSGFIPFSIPAQYAASNWRAVHPSAPSPLVVAASRSQTHLPPAADLSHRASYHSRYARSSVSLTRPHRLSTSTPMNSGAWSSYTGSTSPRASQDDAQRHGYGLTPAGQTETSSPGMAAAAAMAKQMSTVPQGHGRHASAPDTWGGAQMARRQTLQAQSKTFKTLVKSSSATALGAHARGGGGIGSKTLPAQRPALRSSTSTPQVQKDRHVQSRSSIGAFAPQAQAQAQTQTQTRRPHPERTRISYHTPASTSNVAAKTASSQPPPQKPTPMPTQAQAQAQPKVPSPALLTQAPAHRHTRSSLAISTSASTSISTSASKPLAPVRPAAVRAQTQLQPQPQPQLHTKTTKRDTSGAGMTSASVLLLRAGNDKENVELDLTVDLDLDLDSTLHLALGTENGGGGMVGANGNSFAAVAGAGAGVGPGARFSGSGIRSASASASGIVAGEGVGVGKAREQRRSVVYR